MKLKVKISQQLRGNALPSEEIQMDTNGDGIVDETESQNTVGAKQVCKVLVDHGLRHRVVKVT